MPCETTLENATDDAEISELVFGKVRQAEIDCEDTDDVHSDITENTHITIIKMEKLHYEVSRSPAEDATPRSCVPLATFLISNASQDKGTRQNKNGRKRKEREERRRGKRREISLDRLGLDTSLLPWRVREQAVSQEMEREFLIFQQDCSQESTDEPVPGTSKLDENANIKNNVSEEIARENKTDIIMSSDKRVGCDVNEYQSRCSCYAEDSFENCIVTREYDHVLSQKDFANIERLCGNLCDNAKRIRRKKKWRVEKARKQAKSKYCRRLCNSAHGVTYYMHHRKYKLMPMAARVQCDICFNPSRISIRQIDKKYDRIQKEQGFKLVPNPTVPASRQTGTKRQTVKPAYVLNAHNADDTLEADLVNVLMALQERDVTPEDYEILLRLDERVKPKSVEETTIHSFRTAEVTQQTEEMCAICLEVYIIGQKQRILPCGHYFHDDCTFTWLKSSTKCPLDGLEITQ